MHCHIQVTIKILTVIINCGIQPTSIVTMVMKHVP